MGATTAAAASSRAVGAATIAEAFRITAEDHPDRVAVRTKDDEVSLTWAELRDRVDAFARGLHELGVRRGDTVALMLGNRPEFHIADLAVMTLGATPFSIYATSSPEQISYVVGDAKAKVAVVEELFLAQFRSARAELPELEHVVLLEGAQGDDTLGWADVEATESDLDVEAAWRAVEPEDLITLIYTSGTTGPPKGVQLVHRNLMAATKGVEQLIRFPDGSKVISWLPSAHIAERMAHHYLPIVYAMTITTCPNPREVVGYLPAVKPTWFFAVPRIWEKLKAGHGGLPGLGRGRRAEAGAAGRGDAQGRARAGRRAGPRRPRRDGGRGRREAVLADPRDARLRPDRGGQRGRGADAARGARVLPRDRRAARRAVGHVGDLRRGRVQPAREDQDRHGRAADARASRPSWPRTASC